MHPKTRRRSRGSNPTTLLRLQGPGLHITIFPKQPLWRVMLWASKNLPWALFPWNFMKFSPMKSSLPLYHGFLTVSAEFGSVQHCSLLELLDNEFLIVFHKNVCIWLFPQVVHGAWFNTNSLRIRLSLSTFDTDDSAPLLVKSMAGAFAESCTVQTM